MDLWPVKLAVYDNRDSALMWEDAVSNDVELATWVAAARSTDPRVGRVTVTVDGTVTTWRNGDSDDGHAFSGWMELGTFRTDDNGKRIRDAATCGTCGKTWDDALITSRTPAPSGRCPFEADHQEPPADGMAELACRFTAVEIVALARIAGELGGAGRDLDDLSSVQLDLADRAWRMFNPEAEAD